MNNDKTKALVPTGRILISEHLYALRVDVSPYIMRHKRGEWGNVTTAMKQNNEREMQKPEHRRLYIRSRHQLPDGTDIRIVTNPQLGVTCVLLSGE